jgi:hypothetical protein
VTFEIELLLLRKKRIWSRECFSVPRLNGERIMPAKKRKVAKKTTKKTTKRKVAKKKATKKRR